jgi:hypothetical protein
MNGPGRQGGPAWQAQAALAHDVPRQACAPGRPGFLLGQQVAASQAGTMTPGRALIALHAELAACGLPAADLTITRLNGLLTLAGGLAVRYCCGWLVWPAGRLSRQGRPQHTLHSAQDPAGAARRLALLSATGPVTRRGEALVTDRKPGMDASP